MTEPLTVYVPTTDCDLWSVIDRGSGIVGSPADEKHIRLDFEGNRYGIKSLERFADRVHRATIRHLRNDGQGYPTQARRVVGRDQLVEVGSYDPLSGTVTVFDSVALKQWTGLDRLTERELVTVHATSVD